MASYDHVNNYNLMHNIFALFEIINNEFFFRQSLYSSIFSLATKKTHKFVDSPEYSNSFSVESGTDTQVSGDPIVWVEFMKNNKAIRRLSMNNVDNVVIPKIVRALSGNLKTLRKANVKEEIKRKSNRLDEERKEEINRIFNADKFKRARYDLLLDNYKAHEKTDITPKKDPEPRKVIGHFKGFPALIIETGKSY